MKVICFSLMLFLTSSALSLSAQSPKDEVYVDYDELLRNVLPGFKAAQAKQAFIGSAALRKQTQGLPLGSKAQIASLVKSGKKLLTGPQIVEARKEGVFMICKYLKAEAAKPESVQMYATATAITGDGVLVSNWHVFVNVIEPLGELPANDSVTFVLSAKGEIYPIEKILAHDKYADATIFKINTGKQQLTVVPLGSDLAVGETVHTLTNPENYLYYYSKGVVARNTADRRIGPMANRMEITADFAKGSSGGPIFDERGNMAGMVSSTHSIYAQDRPQGNLQMVIKTTIPVRSIRSLLQTP